MKVVVLEATGQGKLCHYTFGLCDALERVGVRVVLITNKAYELAGVDKGFEVRSLFNGSGHYSSYYPRLLKMIRDEDPDVIHIQWFPTALSGYILLRLLRAMSRARIVFTIHNILPHERRALRHGLYREIYRRVDRIVAPSRFSMLTMMEIFDIDPSKISIVPDRLYLGGPPHSREEAERRLGLPLGERRILFFGYIREHKGLDLLIKAYAQVRKGVPRSRLLVAGRPECDIRPYMRLIEDLHLKEGITLDLRYIPSEVVPHYFMSCDVVVLPYLKVCHSPIVQLAYSFGRPVVTTEYAGDLVEDGRSGRVVPIERGDDLGDVLVDLLSSDESLGEMGERARRIFKERYSWRPFVERILRVYRD